MQVVQCGERMGLYHTHRRRSRRLRPSIRHPDVRLSQSGRRRGGGIRLQGIGQGTGGYRGDGPAEPRLQGIPPTAHVQKEVPQNQVLQLWRVCQPHCCQVHPWAPAEAMPPLQICRPPDRRLPPPGGT